MPNVVVYPSSNTVANSSVTTTGLSQHDSTAAALFWAQQKQNQKNAIAAANQYHESNLTSIDGVGKEQNGTFLSTATAAVDYEKRDETLNSLTSFRQQYFLKNR